MITLKFAPSSEIGILSRVRGDGRSEGSAVVFFIQLELPSAMS
jgi:hypothetical protein